MSNTIPIIGSTIRQQLPNRRMSVNETISFARSDGNTVDYDATIGFDALFRPREIFLFGAKDGSDMYTALLDTAVALSVALQNGVSATSMARSLYRTTDGMPASIVGAALDLIAKYEVR
jgi:hypothetical protein